MFVTDVVLCKILFKSEQICGCCCKMLRGSLFWDTRYVRLALATDGYLLQFLKIVFQHVVVSYKCFTTALENFWSCQLVSYFAL